MLSSSSRSRSTRFAAAGALVSCLALGALGALPAQADPLPDPGLTVPGAGSAGTPVAPGGAAAPLPPAPDELPDVPEAALPEVPLGDPAAPAPPALAAPEAPQAATAAAADDEHVAFTALTFDVVVGEGIAVDPTNPLLPSEQTCTVDADLYLPPEALGENPVPVPAILTTNGFGGDKTDQAGAGEAFTAEGYAVLSYTGLGFPDSGCVIYLDDPAFDGEAASHLVDFLAGEVTGTRDGSEYSLVDVIATDESGPRVGMVGGSYGGQVQFAAASIDDRIDALVPLITWNDLQYSLAPNNTSLDGVTPRTPGTQKIGWTSAFFGLGIADGIEGSLTDPDADGCANFRIEACEAKLQLDRDGYPDDETIALTEKTSVAHYIEDVRAPTLLIQGQNDTLFNLQEAVTTYRSLQAQGTEVQMVWQSWGHSGGGQPAEGELDLSGGDLRSTVLGERILDWFDLHVKDDTTTPVGREFSYFQPWEFARTGTAQGGTYASADAYPVGSEQQLFLSGGAASSGDLVTDDGAIEDGTVSWTGPGGTAFLSVSEVSAAPDQPPVFDAPGAAGTWTTPGLAADLDIVGVPRLDVRFDSAAVEAVQAEGPRGQLLVFAKLYDVGPDGTQTLVNRLISPTRVADVTQAVRIELPGIVHRVAKGHQIRLVLAATDAAYKNAALPPLVSVHATGQGQHVLTLPTMSALALQPPADGGGEQVVTGPAGEAAPVEQLSSSRRPGRLPRTGVEIAGLVLAGLVLAGSGYELVRRSRRA